MKNLIAVFVFAALAMAGNRAFAQANVLENQKTYLYVSARSGSDSSSGSASAPLRTIGAAASRALANNARGVGTKVLINPGIYREFVSIPSAATGAAITFQAITPGTAILDGADVLTGWQALNGTEYVHSWNNTLGGCSLPPGWTGIQPIVQRNEIVFVNGNLLTQILNTSDRRPGTFLVNPQTRQIHIWAPTGTNMNTALVEVAARQQTLEVHGVNNMVFRGLVFRHAGSCINTGGANVFSSDNILFDQVQAVWNNWGGFVVSTSNHITVQNSVGSYNGGFGLSSFESQNALYQYDETDYNNWRGAMGALYDFGQGGMKLLRLHGGKVLKHFSYRNHAQGLWFDTDGKNLEVDSATLSENRAANLQLEANEGPVTVQNSSLCSGQLGLELVNTAGLTMTGNNFYNNGGVGKWDAQLFLAGNPGGRSISDWQTGQPYHIYTSHTTLLNNVFTDASAAQHVFSTYLSGNDWAQFRGSFHSAGNIWNDPRTPAAFQVPGSNGVTLSGWQNITGQDHNSSWRLSNEAAKNCAVPRPSYPDFNVYADGRSYWMSRGAATINLQARSFDFAAATLSTSALPPGVSASFSTSRLTSGDSVLTLKASSRAATETVPVTVFATSGSRVHSVTVSVTIRP